MIALICAGLVGLEASDPPPLPREFRGVWVATVDNIDWPSKPGLPEATQRKELLRIIEHAANLNLNAIVFQVRPSADALYRSNLEPTSWFLTGEQGAELGWDPLEFAILESHRRGIEVHAWLNPFRAYHPAQKGRHSEKHVAIRLPDGVRDYGAFQWMDPGHPAAVSHSLAVFLDLVNRYDLDGIHIDDYFYPYPVRSAGGEALDFPDGATYTDYRASGGTLSIGDWRRKNVNTFVQMAYESIKSRKPHVKFGISPFGIYRPNVPQGIKAGIDQYAQLYADPRLWLRQGWCDYMSPQLYWPVAQRDQSYERLLEWWQSQSVQGRHIWPGNYTSRLNPQNGNWKAEEIVRQIAVTRKLKAGGNLHFSEKALRFNWNKGADALKSGPYKGKALGPASRWLSATPPSKPGVTVDWRTGSVSLTASPTTVRFLATQALTDSGWQLARVQNVDEFSKSKVSPNWMAVAVRAVDKAGVEGPPIVLRRPAE